MSLLSSIIITRIYPCTHTPYPARYAYLVREIYSGCRPDRDWEHVRCHTGKEGLGPRASGAHVGMGVPRRDGIIAVSLRAQ